MSVLIHFPNRESLWQEFQFRVDHDNRAAHMFPAEVIPHMFSNVKSIYKLHHDFLLPQLEDRMAQWHLNPRIGKGWLSLLSG